MTEESSAKSIIDALHPAEIQTIILHPRSNRAIAVVQEDQLAVALGQRRSRIRGACRTTGWDIEIMTPDEWEGLRDSARVAFGQMPGSNHCAAERLVDEGLVTYYDLTRINADELTRITGLALPDVDIVVRHARQQLDERPGGD